MAENGSITVPRQQKPSRSKASIVGQIVEVNGGHIIRSTGRKDRHSKVCTSKGPRDRRVRLAAHTAIQFYDVQDRLGYDRPSKAVDWLMKNAKVAIDGLDQLPAWKPTVATSPTVKSTKELSSVLECGNAAVSSPTFCFDRSEQLDSEYIFDGIKGSGANGSTIGFQDFQQCGGIVSSQSNDLRLSLQSFGDSMFRSQNAGHSTQNSLFSGSVNLPLDALAAGWAEQGQRVAWNGVDTVVAPAQNSVVGSARFLSEREPLQSSNLSSARAWAMEPVAQNLADVEHHVHHLVHPFGPSYGFGPGVTFSGFHVPARIQGEAEHGVVVGNKMSSAAPSAYRH